MNTISKVAIREGEELWHEASFEVDGVQYTSLGQYLAAEKARLFEDHRSLVAILQTSDPHTLKELGKHIVHFDEQVWAECYYDLVVKGTYEKLRQL